MKKKPILILFVLLFLVLLLFFPNSKRSQAATVIVDASGGGDYLTIQEGINNANPSDTVLVKAGTYSETLTISKSITLQGEDKNTVIVDGGSSTYIITVSNTSNVIVKDLTGQRTFSGEGGYVVYFSNSPNCEVRNINAEGGGIIFWTDSHDGIAYGNYIHNSRRGIQSGYADNVQILNNIIEDTTQWQVAIGTDATGTVVSGNEFINPPWNAIEVIGYGSNTISNNTFHGGSSSMRISTDANNNIIENNTIYDSVSGIKVSSNSSGNIVRNNTIYNNSGTGLYLAGSTSNNVFYDNIIRNNGIGILVDSAPLGNTFYSNVLVGNTIQAQDDSASSTWYNTVTSVGNYYSDKITPDTNLDGIVDTPFSISGAGGAEDPYPIAKAVSKYSDTNGNLKEVFTVRVEEIFADIIDHTRNTDITAQDTFNITLTNTVNTDQETITLQEVGVNTGRFRNTTGLSSKVSDTHTSENNILEISNNQTDNITFTYTNPYDSNNTGTATCSMVNVAAIDYTHFYLVSPFNNSQIVINESNPNITFSWTGGYSFDSFTLYIDNKLIQDNIPENSFILDSPQYILDSGDHTWYVEGTTFDNKVFRSATSFNFYLYSDINQELDSDNDGLTNREEYEYNTDPTLKTQITTNTQTK